jgi:predicted nucleotidyltransferase
MRTTNDETLLSHLMPSRVRRDVLCALLLDDSEWHPRELSRVLGLTNSAVAAELNELHVRGIAERRRVGNQARYRADKSCPVYLELRSLLVKTAGVADHLRRALAPLAERIDLAYIFGSFASGKQRSGSDVDVMVIGQLSSDEVLDALGPAEESLRREINAVVYAPEQFEQGLAAGEGFIYQQHRGPKITLVGKLDE